MNFFCKFLILYILHLSIIKPNAKSELHHKSKRSAVCGSTSLRLNLNLTKLYGEWIPLEESKIAWNLWMSSIYGNNYKADLIKTCPVFEFISGKNSASIVINMLHQGNKATVEAILIGDQSHPSKSKWAISWPNKEETLTSVIAAGNIFEENYKWLLILDCDLNGKIEPDWIIFTRSKGISNSTLAAIEALVDEIDGIKMSDFKKNGRKNCNFK